MAYRVLNFDIPLEVEVTGTIPADGWYYWVDASQASSLGGGWAHCYEGETITKNARHFGPVTVAVAVRPPEPETLKAVLVRNNYTAKVKWCVRAAGTGYYTLDNSGNVTSEHWSRWRCTEIDDKSSL